MELFRFKLGPKLGTFFHYQRSFRPNCIWRAVVEVPVMAPAVPESPDALVAVGGVKTIRFGVLKLALFNRLKISRRNWSCKRSCIVVFFSTEKSHVASPG